MLFFFSFIAFISILLSIVIPFGVGLRVAYLTKTEGGMVLYVGSGVGTCVGVELVAETGVSPTVMPGQPHVPMHEIPSIRHN
jgi:hypothetical protein